MSAPGRTPRGAGSLARALVLLLAVFGAVGVSGCTGDTSEIQAWMEQERATAPRRNSQVPEPKRFVPFRYEPRADVDPFSNTKLQVALAKFAERNRGGLAPDLNRRREPLEAFPLDAVRLVGHLYRASTGPVALLQVDKVIFQAKVGNFVGQHFGRITRISESEVGLKELVQDAAGDWTERDTTLELNEAKK